MLLLSPMFSSRRFVWALLLAIAGGTLLVLVLLARPGESSRSASLNQVSNDGVLVSRFDVASRRGKLLLDHAGVKPGSVRLLGEQDGTTFYVSEGVHSPRERCYLIARGKVNATSPGIVACGDLARVRFPAPDAPLLDFSAFTSEIGANTAPTMTRLQGFAADGVATIGVVDITGKIHRIPVINNVYAKAQPPAGPVTALIALDRNGNVVYTKPVTGGTD